MKKIALPLLILTLTLLACNITPSPTALPPTEPPVTEPPVTEPPVTEPPLVNNVTCNELSLYLDPALGTSFDCQTIPASPDEMDLYPEHTELTIYGYPLADKFFDAHIAVFPVGDYTSLAPTLIPGRVTDLQALISGGLPGDSLPFLPQFNAAQAFHALYAPLGFTNGGGIRFLTIYAQYLAPVNNHDLFYTYQGLTTDGQNWISAIMPINHAILPANADNPPDGLTWEEFANQYEPYINEMINQLAVQPADSYTPSLEALDTMMSSISLYP